MINLDHAATFLKTDF